jgi:hypothetical protein
MVQGDLKMGMFDYISNRLYCPFCGEKQRRCAFQTKSFKCFLDTLTLKKKIGCWIGEPAEIHSACSACGSFIRLTISTKDVKEKKKQMG